MLEAVRQGLLDFGGLALHFGSFNAVWYWIFVALSWSRVSHYTLSVPHDAVQRAERLGGVFIEDVDHMAHAYVRRAMLIVRHGGMWVIGVGAFLVTIVVALAIVLDMEFAQAIAAIVVPRLGVIYGTMALAERIERENLLGTELRQALNRRRFWNQVLGLASIVAATLLAVRNYALEIEAGNPWL
ncbi:MAG: component of SufBCD complex [Pseudomonadota bacterium]